MHDADLPSGADISSNFNFLAAGFAAEHHVIITEVVAPDWPGFVRKSGLRADSFLARMSDEDSTGEWRHCADTSARSIRMKT
jgi:hypothetical protein